MKVILHRQHLLPIDRAYLDNINQGQKIPSVLSLLPISYDAEKIECELIAEDSIHFHACVEETLIFLLGISLKKLFPTAIMQGGGIHPTKGFYYDLETTPSVCNTDLRAIADGIHQGMFQDYKFILLTRDECLENFKHDEIKIQKIEQTQEQNFIVGMLDNVQDILSKPLIFDQDRLSHFMITETSGVHHSGAKKLSRIYGRSFVSAEETTNYLTNQKDLKKSDHRELGKALQLFHFQAESAGMAYWHPAGLTIWKCIENYIRVSNAKYGCLEVKTPILAKHELWEKSGHVDKYAQNIFSTKLDDVDYIIKPMNCPLHVQIFTNSAFSYKSLPVRFSEFGVVHRNESSGALHGLFRGRSFVQDDAHIFCEPHHIRSEVRNLILQALETYRDFGFQEHNIIVKLALRPDERIGSDDQWNYAEQSLSDALKELEIKFTVSPKEGAFYGPKIEFHLKDNIGREWQCGTIQVDLFMTPLLECTYIDSNSEKKHPILIHRAILGSIERFIGILLEHYQGNLPLAFAPTQIILCNISTLQEDYIKDIHCKLLLAGIRVEMDLRNETLNAKVRDSKIRKIPLIAVAGAREQEKHILSVRDRQNKIHELSTEDLLILINSKGDMPF